MTARRRLGATQADLAKKANLSLRTVTHIEAGDGIVSDYNALCEVAGVSAERADVRPGAALIDVYGRIYANQHARPAPNAQRRAGMR